jgi:hypothetical protein
MSGCFPTPKILPVRLKVSTRLDMRTKRGGKREGEGEGEALFAQADKEPGLMQTSRPHCLPTATTNLHKIM